jgi:hypothetical protein
VSSLPQPPTENRNASTDASTKRRIALTIAQS